MRLDVRLDRREQHQVAAGGTADQADRVRVDVEGRRIGAHVTDASRDVLHRTGMLAVATVPEVQREHGEPVPCQVFADHHRRMAVIAGPRAAMDHDDRAPIARRGIAVPITLGQQVGRIRPTVDLGLGLNGIYH